MKRLYERHGGGLILSAPIEKGVLPVMVLGETGIVGATVFAMFLLSFWVNGSKMKLYMSIAMLVVFLATNMGEATFFSPGGIGGIQWVVCLIGGYTLDLWLLTRVQMVTFIPVNPAEGETAAIGFRNVRSRGVRR